MKDGGEPPSYFHLNENRSRSASTRVRVDRANASLPASPCDGHHANRTLPTRQMPRREWELTMRLSKRVLVTAAIILLSLGTTAAAVTRNVAMAYDLCVQVNNGSVRAVNVGDPCRSSENSMQLPIGPAGPAGPAGPWAPARPAAP